MRKIENFVRSNCYPRDISEDKGKKTNKNFKIVDGHLTYKGKRRVIFANGKKRIIIHDVHEGLVNNPKVKSQHGGESTC